MPHDFAQRDGEPEWNQWRVRRQLPEALMRPGLVIVAEELTEDALEMTGSKGENVV